MANEISVDNPPLAPTGSNLYTVVRRPTDTYLWKTTTEAFAAYSASDWTAYAIALTEQGATAFYSGDFPEAIGSAGAYTISVYKRSGGSPAVSDTLVASGNIDWDGSAEVTAPTGHDLTTRGYVKIALGITDTSSDEIISQKITDVSVAITKYLHRDLTLQSYAETRSGSDTDYLRAWQTPITAIDSVVFDYDSSSPTEVDGDQFIYEGQTGLIKFKRSASSSRLFSSGFQNVQLNYSAGYSTVPADVQDAVATLVGLHLFRGTIDNMGVVEKSVGDVKIKWDDPVTIDPENPALGAVIDKLRPYRLTRY